MKRTSTLLTLFLALSIQLGAKDIYLSATGDDNNDGSSKSNAVSSLLTAYNLSDDNDVIRVSGMVPHSYEGIIIINKSISIIGEDENAGFDRQGSLGKFFDWKGSGNFNLEQLTFQNGSAGDGGAISLVSAGNATDGYTAGNVTLKGCSFKNNTATGRGGAVYMNGCHVSFVECMFEGNTGKGGAIQIRSNQIVANYEVTHSLFKDNNSIDDGGAFYCSSNGEPVNIKLTNSTFYGNNAVRGGGAIAISHNDASDLNITMTNLTITENNNDGNIDRSGGIRIDREANVTINNCLIYNNWCDGGSTTMSDIGGGSTATGVVANNSIIGHVRPSQADRMTFSSCQYNEDITEAIILNPLNADGVVTYAADALPVNFADPYYLNEIGNAVDQLDMVRLINDGFIDAGAYEYGATEENNSFPTTINRVEKNEVFNIQNNPVINGAAKVQLKEPGVATVEVFSLSGAKVSRLTGAGIIEIPCSSLSPGIYLVVVEQSGSNSVRKLVIK